MNKLVDQAIANRNSRTPAEKNAASQDASMRAVESILADRIYNRIIGQGYYRPSWKSSYYRPYYPNYSASYLNPGLSYDVNRLLNYHKAVDSYSHVNNVLGHTLDPRLEEILGVAYDLVNKKPAAANSTAPAKAAAPAAPATPAKAAAFVQLEGPPVFVDPSLQ